jgi:hypothetical protein
MEPRKVVGSVDTSEFLVALAASIGFLVGLGSQGVKPAIILPLLAGGVVAALLAAWLVQLMTARVLGAAVGGLILLTNAKTMLTPSTPAARCAIRSISRLLRSGSPPSLSSSTATAGTGLRSPTAKRALSRRPRRRARRA